MTYDFDQQIDRRHSVSLKWDEYGEDVLPMWVADMDFRSPEPVIEALHERVEHGVFGFSRAPHELREVIVGRLEQLYRWRVSPEEVIFLPSVVTGFNLVCHAAASPGESVLLQTPVYYPMLSTPASAGLTNSEMELTRRRDGRSEVDLDRVEGAITERTRVFMLCNPYNPVAHALRREELARMAEICLRHDIVICADEIHADLILVDRRLLPMASLAPKVAERTVTLMGPSKTYDLAELNCSFAIVQNAELRAKLETTFADVVPSVGVLGFAAALAAYAEGQPWLDALLDYLEGNLEFLLRTVEDDLPGITMARPEATYLAWLSCHDAGIPGNPREFFLERAKVAVNDGAAFGRGGEGFVRLNFGCPRSMLAEALERMTATLTTLC
jgi:cystathionine beta-lyase